MANSASRQLRCQSMVTNGAVFFEALMRNIQFSDFSSYWGASFDIAIGAELRKTTSGQLWFNSTTLKPKLAISDEIILWQLHGVTKFDTQWQNYKSIGVVNYYSIQNAFGALYDFTLQYSNSTNRLDQQTTFKMYWGLANDLLAVSLNTSGIGGMSLIRSSPEFAFTNTSIQTLLIQNGTMSSPLGQAFTIVSNVIGQFGSIDMHFMPCPKQAKDAVHAILSGLRQTLLQNETSQSAYSQIYDPLWAMNPAPKAWTDINYITVGGSPLCPEVAVAASTPINQGLLTLLSWEVQCMTSYTWSNLAPNIEAMISSAILANLSSATFDDIARICVQNAPNSNACLQFLNQTVSFVVTFLTPLVDDVNPLVFAANTAIRALNVEFLQFGQMDQTSPVVLYRLNVLDPSQTEFTYFAWNFLVDWARGYREAVSFQGDVGTISLLTEILLPHNDPVNLGENPASMAIYLQNTVMFITCMMIVIATLLLVYVVVGRGHVETFNLLEIQRVGAIVWIGRTLLFVLSLTAVALLSTCPLQLVFDGSISYFQVVQDPWYKTFLAANEVTWLAAIVNDIAMAWTQEYTTCYATLNSVVVWLAVASLTFATPINHSMTIDKQCHIAQMDMQVVCTSGTLVVGHKFRFMVIFGIVVGSKIMCYVGTILLLPKPRPSKVTSLFVYAGARYLFTTSKWIQGDIYYMDRMSAVINGILTVRWRNVMYALDVKLWKTFRVDLLDETPFPPSHEMATAARLALPLNLDEI
ncbi:Aste57867_2598 [Aphanomyces stellatus]|uniref:Aste57867_2598 protein n=1 Tax=Aphanomyces stellatus TaxID=120398 RepID=A0A485K912_9STRA|nr:hypothetical protein As57867_002591 [Aphanomyces stellatus]VFT79794.1 Aste57867_2598 [Aphanomyces stellatus]